jgi:hypothetical protein
MGNAPSLQHLPLPPTSPTSLTVTPSINRSMPVTQNSPTPPIEPTTSMRGVEIPSVKVPMEPECTHVGTGYETHGTCEKCSLVKIVHGIVIGAAYIINTKDLVVWISGSAISDILGFELEIDESKTMTDISKMNIPHEETDDMSPAGMMTLHIALNKNYSDVDMFVRPIWKTVAVESKTPPICHDIYTNLLIQQRSNLYTISTNKNYKGVQVRQFLNKPSFVWDINDSSNHSIRL